MNSRETNLIRAVLFLLAILIAVPRGALAQAPPQGAPGGTPPGGGANAMKEPFPPFHIIGNIYYVGSAGLACYIIKTLPGPDPARQWLS